MHAANLSNADVRKYLGTVIKSCVQHIFEQSELGARTPEELESTMRVFLLSFVTSQLANGLVYPIRRCSERMRPVVHRRQNQI